MHFRYPIRGRLADQGTSRQSSSKHYDSKQTIHIFQLLHLPLACLPIIIAVLRLSIDSYNPPPIVDQHPD